MSYPNEIERLILCVTSISDSYWGHTLTIEGFQDSELIRYAVTYTNCKLIRWESVEDKPEELSSPVADVIGWEMGEGNHKKPAIITTDFFEMSVWYEKYEITEQKVNSGSPEVVY